MEDKYTRQLAEARDCTAKGAILLDQTRPSWPSEIDRENLYVSDVSKCICAQLFGGYGIGLSIIAEATGMTNSSGKGFACSHDENVAYRQAWGEEIDKRRGVRVLSASAPKPEPIPTIWDRIARVLVG